MTSHCIWMLCPLLLDYCDKPELADTSCKEPPSVSSRSVRAARQVQPNSPEAHPAVIVATREYKHWEVGANKSADFAWNAVDTDFGHAGEMIRQLPADHPEQMRLVLHYAMSLADRDPDEVITWATALGSEREIAAANGQIVVAIAESDPQRASSLLSDSGVANHECDVAIVQVVQRWAAQFPADAAAWTASFPAGAARESGLAIIVSQWAKSDLGAAFTWMRALRDEAVHNEPALAMKMALLQQSYEVHERWLQTADSKTWADLTTNCRFAIKQIGDNVSTTLSLTPNPACINNSSREGKPQSVLS